MNGDFRHCPGCGGFIDPEDGTFPDACPDCGWDGEMGTPADYWFSKVYGGLDGTGGTLNALANGFGAAEEAGFHIESDRDRFGDVENGLQRAFEEMDSDDPDPEEVLDWVDHAASAASETYRGMTDGLREYELPDYVDSGVYDTLGGYMEYVVRDLYGLREHAEQWAEAAA